LAAEPPQRNSIVATTPGALKATQTTPSIIKAITTLLTIVSLGILLGCDATSSKKLTPRKAQDAVDQIKKGTGAAVVTGVRTQQASAATIVDVTLTNFDYTDKQNAITTYSGAAEAVFQDYTDGRWTLKQLKFPDQNSKSGDTVELSYNITVN